MEKKNTNEEIPTIYLDEIDLWSGKTYSVLGGGHEGDVYEYDSDYAFKVFTYANLKRVQQKIKKIEKLSKLRDESFCFPLGFVDFLCTDGEQKDCVPKAYYMSRVQRNRYFKDFEKLFFMSQFYGNELILDFILQGDAAIRRVHQQNIIIGDIKGENILIDNDNKVRFCDTDNYMIESLSFDADPVRAHYLEVLYDDDTVDPKDSDIFLYTIIAIEILASKDDLFRVKLSHEFFNRMLELIDTSKEIKDGLAQILSDSKNKPYLNEVIKDLDCEKKILSKRAIDELKSIKGERMI